MTKLSRLFPLWCAAAASFFPVAARAQNYVANVAVGSEPNCVAVNPVTNLDYVANFGSNTVSVISGQTHAVTATVAVGVGPVAIAVNPVTNQIYVACNGDAGAVAGGVTVIDGATRATSTIPALTGPATCIAVNPVTNKIFVGIIAPGGAFTGSQVAVIDGTSATMVAAVTDVNGPVGLAVNPVTDKIYVADDGEISPATGGSVTVIDGSSNYAASTIAVGGALTIVDGVAVNPVTDQVYASTGVAGSDGGTLYVINGATAAVTASAVIATGPHNIAVNLVTNQVYVANTGGVLGTYKVPTNNQIWTMSVVDGNSGTIVTSPVVGSSNSSGVTTGVIPYAVAVNPATNEVYVSNWNGGSLVGVIDGASNSFSTLAVTGTGSGTGITVNPVTNQVCVANYGGNVTVIDGTVNVTASLPTGNFPLAMALNPVTNKLYVVNFIANTGVPGTVTVINATTQAVEATLTVGVAAWAVDVNPVTNKIYVVNSGETPFAGSVSVIDGATDTVTATVPVGVDPDAVVVNPDTNKIFVTNNGYGSSPGSVSVLDGATNTVSGTLPMRPYAIAVNPATNRVYLSNYHSVTVADGGTGATLATVATISAGNIAVNRVTGKIYVLNNQDNNGDLDTVTIIDGATNTVLATPGTQLDPAAIAINPTTNMVYIVDQGNGENGYVTVINGATNAAVGFVATPIFPDNIAVNPVTNKIYVGNFGAGGLGSGGAASGTTVTVIDGDNAGIIGTVTTGNGPTAIAVNPVTDQAYVLNQGASLTSGGSVTVLGAYQAVPLSVGAVPFPGNATASLNPSLTFTAQSLFSPIAPPPQNVFFQLDSLTGSWTQASSSGSSFSATVALSPGLHTLYAYAGDGQAAASTQLDSPLTGAVSAYDFVVTSAATQLTLSAPAAVTAGTAFNVVVTATDAFGNPPIGFADTVALATTDANARLQPASSSLDGVAGTYAVTLYGAPEVRTTAETITATDSVNSSLTVSSGTINVIKTLATVQVPGPDLTYNGAPQGVAVTTNPFGLPVDVVYTGLSPASAATSAPPATAGVYEVTATVDDPNLVYYGSATNFLYIAQATPSLTWAAPENVAAGTALSALQLDATSSVPGTFSYTPAAGTVLPSGSQTLGVTFTPADATDYAAVSASTTLTVNPPPSVLPAITAPPVSQLASPGALVVFAVTATGYPVPTYQWYFNGAPISGATGSTYSVLSAQTADAGIYSVAAANSQGSVVSPFAALAVLTGEFSGDANLTQPGGLATDGTSLFVGGANAGAGDPNRNPASGQSIFSVPLPLGSGTAVSLYPAFAPHQLVVTAGTLFWIDPASGPVGDTQILAAPPDGSGAVNPIYTGSASGNPIVSGGGLATDGSLLYAADNSDGSVWSLNFDGTGLAQIGPNRYAAGSATGRVNAIAVKDGTIYLADSGGAGGVPAVLAIGTAGSSFSTLFSGSPLVSPSAIAVGNGMIYVADPGANNTVWQIPVGGGTPAALVSGSVGTTPIGLLAGLAYDRGTLYAADATGGAIYQFQVAPRAAVPVITSSLAPSGVAGGNFSYQIRVSGGVPPYTYAADGLPAGFSLSSSGLITGTSPLGEVFSTDVTVTDSSAQAAEATVSVTINPFGLGGPAAATALEYFDFYYQVTPTGGAAPYTYAAAGLPAGLTLDPSSGIISGAPLLAGAFPVALTITDSSVPANVSQVTLEITVDALGLTSASSAAGTVGAAFSFQVTAVGGTSPYAFSSTTLPAGLSLDPDSGIISGVPTLPSTSNVTVTVTDSASPANSTRMRINLEIDPVAVIAPPPAAPVVTSNASAGATFGSAFTYTITAGNAPTSFSATGLPGGLEVDPASGIISGTPTAAGSFDVTIGAANATGAGTETLVITVAPGFSVPAISSSSQASGQVGAAFSYAILANNSPTSFAASGLPAGLALSATTGVISGTPAAAGNFTASLTASNTSGPGETFALTIVVASAAGTPPITSAATATGVAGAAFSYAITTSGAATGFTATGLPAGLSLDATTGVISGTPAAAGTAIVALAAANDTGTGAPLSLTIVIQPSAQAPVITSSLTAAGTQGLAFSYAIAATHTPASFAATGLPAGLAVDPATGVISGTPANVGTAHVVLTAANAFGTSSPVVLAVAIDPAVNAPAITSGNTAAAAIGAAFSYQIAATPAATSYAVSGAPAWLGIDTATGLLAGTPTGAPGITSVVLSATNAAGASAPLALAIDVAAAAGTPVVTSTTAPAAGTAGLAYADTAAGCLYPIGVLPAAEIQYYFVNGGLPAGLNLDPIQGFIYGVPAFPGTYTVSVGAANLAGIGASTAVTLTIQAAPGTPTISNTGTVSASAYALGKTIESLPTASGSVGASFSYQISASGNPTSYAADSLPPGLAVNPSTGAITGVPTTAGTFTAEISAANSLGVGAATDLVISISPPAGAPTLSSAPTATATAGAAFTYAMAASNAPASYNASGLPAGLALNSATGLIAGTPAAPGVYTLSLSANNASGTGPGLALTLTVASAVGSPAITSGSTTGATVGAAFTGYQVTASNGPITSYTALNLPAGLVLDPVGGAITGTPAAAGAYVATLTAANAAGPSSPFALLITVAPAATSSSMTSAASAAATSGAAFSYQITGSNSPTSYNVTGLPAGLSVNPATGLISGTVNLAGSYPVTISANNATGTGATSTLTINVANPGSYVRLTNLSARAYVGTGSGILIAGFGISGSGTKQLLVRGVGPGMFDTFRITDDLTNANLAIYDSGPPAEAPELASTVIASQNGWTNNPTAGSSIVSSVNVTASAALMNTLGAFPYAANSLDSAILSTLPVGNYTAQVSGVGGTSGVALAELYDNDPGIPSGRLVNIAARSAVGTGFNILIAGFGIAGNTSETVLIRGVGPRLSEAPFYLAGTLASPQLTLYDSVGTGHIIASNSGWSTAPTTGPSTVVAIVQPASATVMATVGAFPLDVGSNDAAMEVTLPAGNYTAQLSGAGGSIGIGLIEVYEVP